jgi:hypothetical protein
LTHIFESAPGFNPRAYGVKKLVKKTDFQTKFASHICNEYAVLYRYGAVGTFVGLGLGRVLFSGMS